MFFFLGVGPIDMDVLFYSFLRFDDKGTGLRSQICRMPTFDMQHDPFMKTKPQQAFELYKLVDRN